MPKQVRIPISKAVEERSRYIDFKTDFAFRHLFAKESHLDLLKDFLNAVFKGRKVIEAVKLGKTDHKGNRKIDRRTVFDIYCISNKGERFVVEMQQGNRKFFKDRILYYTANLVQEQGKSVDANWNYELPEVYFIAIIDFRLEDIEGNHYIHDVRLMDVNTNRQFYDKLGYIFVELPGFNKSEDQLITSEDNWLFCLKHMSNLKEIPLPLSNSDVFKKLFKIAEISSLNQKDMNAYQANLKIKRDNYSLMETVKETSLKIGIEKGIQQGLFEGRAEERTKVLKERKELAIEMKRDNEPIAKIIKYTKLSIEEIELL
ncbi:MAG: Rpn family recombination-promoting nuclease/putative transposase [Candidatus Pedobacter colombiensis]|uniref:Rpn family recombination-promoting nuclease/putative transposase n=1 Tax=Candidatus Pedobacter colombiensis TaxID=3121371 RepID=A0AAJ5W9Y3_9SPHI|nr:Rpn family recombination-promoting nuclease/putative transposase [Pedobacter sp.]WEK19811.1 MAG: Rpn family recombination-promoting nuclease/putative transposase [Pedobacter sp.]